MSFTSQVKQAAGTIKQSLVSMKGEEDRDILETLRKEHDEVQALLSDLQDAQGNARKALVRKIAHALVPHTKAEQKVVYGAVIALKNKDAKVDGHEGFLEHELASKTLTRLAGLSAGSVEHKATGKVLKELVDHHVKEEEDRIWKDVEANFSQEERIRMNRQFLAEKKKVRVP
jgi:hemerythrin superfamily protein